ncbi:MAG: hypothetical protein OES24_04010 [Acidimicrobiia bacterium]|nr:hypothetical protein [Acidimicrobiia bacterium]
MRDTFVQLLGLLFLVLPLVAIQWNLTGRRRRVPLLSPRQQTRWRLEIYSNADDVDATLVNRADIPFPVKQVRSARGELAQAGGPNAWALPRIELEIDVDDPYTDEVVTGLFGPEHRVRFVSGNEAMIDVPGPMRLRLRALPYR